VWQAGPFRPTTGSEAGAPVSRASSAETSTPQPLHKSWLQTRTSRLPTNAHDELFILLHLSLELVLRRFGRAGPRCGRLVRFVTSTPQPLHKSWLQTRTSRLPTNATRRSRTVSCGDARETGAPASESQGRETLAPRQGPFLALRAAVATKAGCRLGPVVCRRMRQGARGPYPVVGRNGPACHTAAGSKSPPTTPARLARRPPRVRVEKLLLPVRVLSFR
jgi:hypothetical protein